MLARARALLVDLGADVGGPDDLVEFAEQVRDAGFVPAAGEVPILLCATFADASVALAAFGGSPRPVLLWAVRDPAPQGDRLHLNSLCGATLAAHGLVRGGAAVRLLYGDPGEPRVRERLREFLTSAPAPLPRHDGAARGPLAPDADVRAALDGLRGRRLGAVGDTPLGFTTCEYDAGWLGATLGVDVVTLPLEDAFARICELPPERRADEAAEACAESPSMAALDPAEVELSAATGAALADWVAEERLSALALRCWPEFPQQLGGCPCSALGRLAARGVATQCERDVNGGATMLLLDALGAEATYLADIVRVDEAAGALTFWHCGLAPSTLAADPGAARQDTHCNRGVGVAGNFPLRPGRVTIARIGWLGGGTYRLFLAGGEGLPGPNRFKGNSLDVRLDTDVETAVTTFVERGFEHHVALAWGELRPRLRRAAEILGLELVEP